MKLTTMHPERIKSLSVYEPTLFHLVTPGDPLESPAEGIWRAATDAARAFEQGDSHAAAHVLGQIHAALRSDQRRDAPLACARRPPRRLV